MAYDDHIKIRVGEHDVGIMGLKSCIQEIVDLSQERSDEEISALMLEKLSRKNYIPVSARKDYSIALLREYKKQLGLPYDEPADKAVRVVVLGPGCWQCNQLEQTVLETLNKLNLPASFEHITDLKEIAAYGLMRTPALLINNKVVSSGTLPSVKKVKEWLEKATFE